MANDYIDAYMVCPFYQKEDRTKIHCEGINRYTRIQLYFITKEFQRFHEKRYCMDINNYKKCPLYSIIARQYEDKEEIL